MVFNLLNISICVFAQELKRMEAVLRGMLKQERKSKEIFDSGVNPPRIVVGYGACKGAVSIT